MIVLLLAMIMTTCQLYPNHSDLQEGGTLIHSVLRAATVVKMKVNSQFEIFSTVNSQATISI